jgi:tetratricopeptide (TPR) repeat protein
MAAERKLAAAPERQPVTISFAGFNRAWAAWIGNRLERHGHRVTYMRFDPPEESAIEDVLHDLLLAEGRVLIILSDWYFQLGPRTHDEWNHALRTVAAPAADRFAAVSVTTSALPTATAALNAADLWGVGAVEAERRLLARLGYPVNVRAESAEERSGVPRFPYDQPRVWGGVPRRNTRFTGREEFLAEAYHLMQQAPAGAAVCTLLGMSGVGKTQIAAEYVYRFGSEYDAVWWVPSGGQGALRQRLAELAPALELSTGPGYGERLRAVRDALRRGEPYDRWLVVLDGADDPQLVADFLPSGTGHVLITSRNHAWGDYNTAMLDIPVYSREESVAFVRRRARRLGPAEADKLADALGDLPLLLDQTAGWLNDTTTTVDEYVTLLTSGADFEASLKVGGDFKVTFQMAWAILLNQLKEIERESVDLLRLCVFFQPGSIPVRLLRELPLHELPERLTGLMGDPRRWNSAVSKLVQYSVVRLESHETGDDEMIGSPEAFYLHRMVHQAVRDGMSAADREEFSDVVRRALAAADPGRPSDTRTWPRYAELVPQLKAASVLETTNTAIQLLVLNSLRYMYLAGDYPSGIKLAERALEAWKRLLGETHPRIWDLAYHYANVLRASGDYKAAEAVENDAVQHLRAERGSEQDLDLLRAVNGQAASLRGLGRYEEALDLTLFAVDNYREMVGERDARTLNAMNNAAVSLRLLGRYEEALELDRRTLSTRREALRPRHNWTLFSELNYAWDLRLLGRYDEAVSVMDLSVGTHRDVMGPDNPQTLRAEHNLAMCLYRAGDRAKGQQILARVLERAEQVLGEDDPLSVMARAGYAFTLREQGDLDHARAIGEAVTRRYETMLGPDHPFTVGTRCNHALVLRAVGERDESMRLVEKTLVAMTTALGADHPWTLGCALNVTASRNVAGDPEGAAELSRDTAQRAAETLGARHPLTLSSRIALAADLRALRKRQEAEKIEEEALSALAETLGAQHVHTVSARSRTRPYWDFEPFDS